MTLLPDTGLAASQRDAAEGPLRADPRFLPVALFLAAATLAKAPFFGGATVGDVLFVAAAAIAAHRMVRRGPLPRTRWNGLAVTFVLWAMVSGVMVPLVSTLDFSDTELLRSMLRIAGLVIGAILLGTLVAGATTRWVGRMILSAMVINAAIALVVYATAWILPDALSSLGLLSRLSVNFTEGTGFRLVRAQGLFAEPSLLGLFQALGLGYLAFVSRDLLDQFGWRKALPVGSVVLTMSLGAYAMVVAVLAGALLTRRRTDASLTDTASVRASSALAVLAAIGVGVAVLGRVGSGSALAERLSRVLSAQDVSAVGRLVGSWDAALEIAMRSPVFGAGIGNMQIAADGLGYSYSVAGRFLQTVPSWNLFAVALASLGVIGMALYTLLVLELGTRNLAGAVTIGLAGFVTGGLLVATIWVFFAMYAAPYGAVTIGDGPSPSGRMG